MSAYRTTPIIEQSLQLQRIYSFRCLISHTITFHAVINSHVTVADESLSSEVRPRGIAVLHAMTLMMNLQLHMSDRRVSSSQTRLAVDNDKVVYSAGHSSCAPVKPEMWSDATKNIPCRAEHSSRSTLAEMSDRSVECGVATRLRISLARELVNSLVLAFTPSKKLKV